MKEKNKLRNEHAANKISVEALNQTNFSCKHTKFPFVFTIDTNKH